ncbi:hypothetical protein F8O06_01345 [Pseudoclavibacter sp. CFCC 14310]|uniref:glycosyltransferase family 39 protein n=1 Tax=Pseudoclavibacter sp. CFCC 14310 TaxID=2615180 RepID=UPI001300F939|nr:glycosyltransferase family 39 protein [Pseudoclavibacter sp. CFCC 14310]KAB1647247.1 hypothetical protein F8O06_01345 [Pseudoclavibacter sp. CFCC 14310]
MTRMASSWQRWLAVDWALAAVTSVGVFFLALWLAAGQSIWYDEAYSVLVAQSPVDDLFALTAVDAHPPFYYLLVKAWAGVFGWSELSLRSLSALAAGATVFVMFCIVRRMFSSRIALMTLPFVSLSAYSLRYSYEVRMYAIAGLICALATLCLVSVVLSENTRRQTIFKWSAYSLLVVLGMYTMYMCAVVWVAHAIWLAARWHRLRTGPLVKQPWLLAFGAAALLFAAYVPVVMNQLRDSASSGIESAVTVEKAVNFFTMSLTYTPIWRAGAWLSCLTLVAVLLVLYSLRHVVIEQSHRDAISLLTLLSMVPMLFEMCVSLPPLSPHFVNRYISHTVVYPLALLPVLLWLVWRRNGRKQRWVAIISACSVVALQIVGVTTLKATGNFNFDNLTTNHAREVRDSVECSPQNTVVADTPLEGIGFSYYFADCPLYFASNDEVAFHGGYAPLHGSDRRISSSSSIGTPELTVLRMEEPGKLLVDDRYELVRTDRIGSAIVDHYALRP